MATQTATTATSTSPVAGHGFAGNLKRSVGTISPTSVAAADSIEMVRVPKGAVITGGCVYGSRLDAATMASAILDMDIGVIGGDTDQFGNLGVWNHQAIAGLKPEEGYFYPFGGLLRATGSSSGGPQTMSAESVIGLTVVASAAAFVTSAQLTMVVDWYLP